MLILERQNRILEIVNRKKAVTVDELSRRLYSSPATIRRDLCAMEKAGLLKRSHGGAVTLESSNVESALTVREKENIREKRLIAELATDFIRSSSSLFLDSSSTAGAVIPLLARFHTLTVITTGLKNALLLSEKTDARIYLPCGVVATNSNSIIGADTLDYLSNIRTDVAFISCSGMDASEGVTEASVEQAQLKRRMLARAKVRVLLCDNSKFDSVYFGRTCGFDMLDVVITDRPPRPELADAVGKAGCELLFPRDDV